MSFLQEIINTVQSPAEVEDLNDRLDIITHKIKFRDKVEVYVMPEANVGHSNLLQLLGIAGAQVCQEIDKAEVVIFYNPGANMTDLMNQAIMSIQPSYKAAQLQQVYLMNKNPESPVAYVEFLEDIAEIVHPGFFIFGNEGKSWLRMQIALES